MFSHSLVPWIQCRRKNKPHEISAAHSTVMECLGNSSASFVMDIPLAGTEMLSGEGWFSEKDLLHFNCWFVGWKCSSADCRWGTFPCCIAGQSWSAETVLRTMRISVCLILMLPPLFYWALKCDDWSWEQKELPVVPEQSEKRSDLRATSCTCHKTRTISSTLQMDFNIHCWRIHTQISPSYLLFLRGDTVNGLSGSKACDLICLHLECVTVP